MTNLSGAHIKLCNQAYWDAIPVNYHDDFPLWPTTHDTLYEAGPAGYDAPFVIH